ncbi:uncharacterized protein I303_104986 [Kwoniella dejecticola CBS 10117]|uniref:HIT-type domain-containing protein n=1 Tax=Kwoniella dejecticola CBS 10117 TaxID=1296121 RepID=A0A1A6A3S6_9TREE|nr:uncharacterized protein I303_05569 [Kwoniella dejecticola CBS 10117]OBR84710.1 hypothetical protein I303_05569 [Kwoniella dejecticola CBS 10117]
MIASPSMPPRRSGQVSKCQICKDQISKYKCPACPIRYCSVACYKQHKVSHGASLSDPSSSSSTSLDYAAQTEPAPLLDDPTPETEDTSAHSIVVERSESSIRDEKREEQPLKPLTSLLWPPEPDPSIFTDPLQKEDPKPLRHEELRRIATSPDLRTLLSTPKLPLILRTIDSLPSNKRHEVISKLLGVDNTSLSNPDGITSSFLSGRDSPPPLNDLLASIAGENNYSGHHDTTDGDQGWFLYANPSSQSKTQGNRQDQSRIQMQNQGKGQEKNQGKGQNQRQNQGKGNTQNEGDKIWIGPEETQLFKLFAASICSAIDGNEDGTASNHEVAWGTGDLAWEL